MPDYDAKIDVTGLCPVHIFRALYEGSQRFTSAAQSPGFLMQLAYAGEPLSDDQIKKTIQGADDWSAQRYGAYFPDYYRGVPIKVNYRSDDTTQWLENGWLYDRDHGSGRCQQVIADLKGGG